MSEVAGLWDYELERIVQRLGESGAVEMVNHLGKKIVVRINHIAPERLVPETLN